MSLTEIGIFSEALACGRIGLAVLDAALAVRWRRGVLSDWLPQEGLPVCAAPFLSGMEEALCALREGGGEIVLPSMRAGEKAPRVTVSISWNAEAAAYLVVTTPDHAGEQIDRLLASDRREKQLLRQQADAAAARLRVADALYRDIVESSENLVLRFTPDCRVVFANRAAAAFFGRPQDTLAGAAMTALFPSPGQTPCRPGEAGERPVSFEMAAQNAKGAMVWLAWDVSFLGEEGGGEFQAVARDVSAERRLRIERERAQKEARAAAVANERLRIAHDLHDTLAHSIVTMIAQARLIARKTTDAETRLALAELDRQARHGLREAREAIARTRAPRPEDDDLAAIARDFEARAHVGVALDLDPLSLTPDAGRLFAAVLREALRNIELHARARHVRLSLRREIGAAVLEISDDGAGFDPKAPTPGHFGVLGMRERAAAAGAAFTLDSAPGAGTRITVEAPGGILGE